MPDAAPDATLLDDQRAYYRRRAPEYDEWWQRRGRYDQGEDERREWVAQVAELDRALGAFEARGDVLELAGGTGWWSERLARSAERLTVVDASPETLALNAARLGSPGHVRYVVADLFEWRPERRHDVVFFSFWLSHVPRWRFDAFWDLVADSLVPGGRVFLIDNRVPGGPAFAAELRHDGADAADVQRRVLNDGSEHRLVKVFYEPAELEALLAARSWEAHIEGTPLFVFGRAAPRG